MYSCILLRCANCAMSQLSGEAPGRVDQGATCKNLFAYHGGESEPNAERHENKFVLDTRDHIPIQRCSNALHFKRVRCTLNGAERNARLNSNGLTREYMLNRMGSEMHSNSDSKNKDLSVQETGHDTSTALKQAAELYDRKEIYYFSFSSAPESVNPRGHVNLRKVAHTEIMIDVEQEWFALNDDASDQYVLDLWGIGYNFLTMENGVAALTYA